MKTLRRVTLAVALAGMVWGCGDATGIGPENRLEVTNLPDDFQFQVSELVRVTQTLSYTWQNTGPEATIDISQGIAVGFAMLTLTDARGTVVYQEDIAQDGDGQSSVGVPGGWGIRVDLVHATGTIAFRVRRTP